MKSLRKYESGYAFLPKWKLTKTDTKAVPPESVPQSPEAGKFAPKKSYFAELASNRTKFQGKFIFCPQICSTVKTHQSKFQGKRYKYFEDQILKIYKFKHFNSNWEMTIHLQIWNHPDSMAFHEYLILFHRSRVRRQLEEPRRILTLIQYLYNFSHYFHTSAEAFLLFKISPNSFQIMFSIVWTQIQRNLPMSVIAIVYHNIIFSMLMFTSDFTSIDFMEPNEWCLKMNSFFMHELLEMNWLLKDVAVALIIISILKLLIWHSTCFINNIKFP